MGLAIDIVVAFVLVFFVVFLLSRNLKRKRVLPAKEVKEVAEPKDLEKAEPEVEKAPDLRQRLSRTRGKLLGSLDKLWNETPLQSFSEKEWEDVECGLLEADVGMTTTSLLLDRVREQAKTSNGTSLQNLLRNECQVVFDELAIEPLGVEAIPKPLVVSVVGVNGVGKTTTIGKLAHIFSSEGKSVLLGAVDTFRAGAISQLKIWSERVGTQFVSGREGGDPGAVAFDAVSAAKARGIDIVLLDTAGRLHTKTNLMEELKKVHRVVKKVIPEAPHETWLVLDGTLGQNSIRQAVEFHQALGVSGIVVTKLDGTAKGGAILSVTSELKLPVRYIGVGEALGDLLPFESTSFLNAILG